MAKAKSDKKVAIAASIAAINPIKVAKLNKLCSTEIRVKILIILHAGERSVTELAGELNVVVSYLSHELRVLHLSGLLAKDRRWKHCYYSITPQASICLDAMQMLTSLTG